MHTEDQWHEAFAFSVAVATFDSLGLGRKDAASWAFGVASKAALLSEIGHPRRARKTQPPGQTHPQKHPPQHGEV